jgi:hypothetical protein
MRRRPERSGCVVIRQVIDGGGYPGAIVSFARPFLIPVAVRPVETTWWKRRPLFGRVLAVNATQRGPTRPKARLPPEAGVDPVSWTPHRWGTCLRGSNFLSRARTCVFRGGAILESNYPGSRSQREPKTPKATNFSSPWRSDRGGEGTAPGCTYKEALSVKRGRRTPATRTWQIIKRHGILGAAERAVNRTKETSGYTALAEIGMRDFAFEEVGLGAETPSAHSPFSHYLKWHTPMANARPLGDAESDLLHLARLN